MSKSSPNKPKFCDVSRNSKSDVENFSFLSWQTKTFCSKKICGMLVTETLNCKSSEFLNNNMCFCSQLYGICYIAKASDTELNQT